MKNNSNLYFTRQERKSLLIFALMALSFLAMLYSIARYSKPREVPVEEVVQLETASPLKATVMPKVINEMGVSKKTGRSRSYFKFNPNTIQADSLGLLGVDKKTIRVFEKYRSKGALFNNQEQFYKVYGMNKYRKALDSLLVFSMESKVTGGNPSKDIKDDNVVSSDSKNKQAPIPIVKIKYLDINKADSFEWQLIKGIGTRLASRIVKYRERLGGFYSIGQLEEVYGLKSETYLSINHLLKVDGNDVEKIAINFCDEDRLAWHPYIGKKKASILIRYKRNKGNFKGGEDVKASRLFDEEEWEKLSPYIDFRE